MRIAICDDLNEQLEIIKKATIEYFKSKHEPVDIDTFTIAFDFLDAYQQQPYDLVLLDIVMPGLLGTDVAREIRLKQSKTAIIFLTTSDEFAIDAFEVNASHYLLKPFKQETFTKAMDRAMALMSHNKLKMIQFRGPKGILHAVDKDSISYIESHAHHQYVYLLDGNKIETVQTLSDLLNQLNEQSFGQYIMPYKGFIVNQHAISSIESDKLVLKSGVHIPIARRTFTTIKQTYFEYMFGGKK